MRPGLTGCPDKKTCRILGSLICLFFFFAGSAGAEKAVGENWQSLETEHTIIRFLSRRDLRVFDRKVIFSTGHSGFFSVFSPSSKGKDPVKAMTEKVDAIYKRVQEILDMKRGMKKVFINVYPDNKQLKAAFTTIYLRPCRIRAWYRYRNNTIYVNAKDLHAGMLAHEMAHAVIDNYMTVRPPRATAEILARYVDQHLEE